MKRPDLVDWSRSRASQSCDGERHHALIAGALWRRRSGALSLVTINQHGDTDDAIRLVLNDHPHDLDRARKEAVFAAFEPIKTLFGLPLGRFLDF